MSNTISENELPHDGTISNDIYSAGFGTSRKKTIIEGQEELPAKDNPKNVNMLAGFLVSFSRSEIGEYWDLREGNNAIGSAPENNIVLSEKHVSSKHANINISKDVQNNCWKFQIVDLSSTNGTELNGVRMPIYSGTEIKNNDLLKIGEYTLMLFATDRFTHKLTKSDKFQSTVQSASYDSRDYFASNNDATNAGY